LLSRCRSTPPFLIVAIPSHPRRSGKRRRWAPLNHWKNERLQYDEFGAVKAEKLGPVTPVVDKLGKVRAQAGGWWQGRRAACSAHRVVAFGDRSARLPHCFRVVLCLIYDE